MPPARPTDDLVRFLAADLRPRRALRRRRRVAIAPVVEQPPTRATWASSALSLGLHVVAIGLAGWGLARASGSAPPESRPPLATAELEGPLPEVDLPILLEDTELVTARVARADDVATPPHPSGDEPTPRPDSSRAGRGGTPEVNAAAINLAAHDDAIALARSMQSRLDRSQIPRVEGADHRASLDDRRATLAPMEVTFLASGKGLRAERRPLADHDPARGASGASLPGTLGAIAGATPLAAGENASPRDAGSVRAGTTLSSPGAGVLSGAPGADHRTSADVAFARPEVAEGRPAVPATVVSKAKDTVDSAQEVAASQQSLLDASTAGGKKGEGPGGVVGGPTPAAGGTEGPGSKAKVLGQGAGATVDLDGLDKRLSDYRRSVTSKIHPLWKDAFPKWAALEGRQGRAIVHFVIEADGSISAISIARESGIPEFDANVAKAVARAAPFAAIPPKLGAPMQFWLTFDSPNPAVR